MRRSALRAIRARQFPYPGALLHLDFIHRRYWWGGRERNQAAFTTFTIGNGAFNHLGFTSGTTSDLTIATSGIGAVSAYLMSLRHNAAPGTLRSVYQIDDGTVNNRVLVSQSSANVLSLQVVTGGVSQGVIGPGVTTSLTAWHYSAGSFVTNLFNCANNGSLGIEDTSGSIPTTTTLRIGKGSTATSEYLGAIGHLVLFSAGKTRPELQKMSNYPPLLS